MIVDEKTARAAFRQISGIGSQRLRHLIAFFGSACQAWTAPEQAYACLGDQVWIRQALAQRTKISLEKVAEDLEKRTISTAIPGDGCYPEILAELTDAPPLLYYRGKLEASAEALAIVGTRKATAYGKAAASRLAQEVAERGVVIVSGLARGIDTAAHKGALAGKGITWAVLACGVDRIYPPENERLTAEILDQGGAVISEFVPGTIPEARFFPVRNRLISGCSRGVVVVEAALKSGALITVDFALEQGREVFAVPGPIFSDVSKGTHQLLRQGAMVIEGAEDLWREISVWQETPDTVRSKVEAVSDNDEGCNAENASHRYKQIGQESLEQQMVLGFLSDHPLHIDEIALHSNLEPQELALTLLDLVLSGRIVQLPGQHYILARE